MQQPTRIVIADDHHLFVAGLKTILQPDEEDGITFDIAGIAHDGEELIPLLKRIKPELLILDLNMPQRDGLDVLELIREDYPDLKILALTMYDESKIVKLIIDFRYYTPGPVTI